MYLFFQIYKNLYVKIALNNLADKNVSFVEFADVSFVDDADILRGFLS